MSSKLIIYTDGAARGNPGPAGAGALLLGEDRDVVSEVSCYLGEMTNNQAEYRALNLALDEAIKKKSEEIIVYSDSELLVNQINGTYKIKNQGLKPLYNEIIQKLHNFKSYTIKYLPREENSKADKLANLAIDNAH